MWQAGRSATLPRGNTEEPIPQSECPPPNVYSPISDIQMREPDNVSSDRGTASITYKSRFLVCQLHFTRL